MADDPSEVANLTLSILREFRAEMGDMRAEMGDMRAEMGDMRADITDMRADITDMRTDMTEFRAEMTEFRASTRAEMTDMRADIDNVSRTQVANDTRMFIELAEIRGAIRDLQVAAGLAERVGVRVDDHERRITALERREG